MGTLSAVEGWTFLTNHAHVLVCVSRDPDVRARDIAAAVGITERAVLGILNDLVEGGYIERERVGRRNHYTVNGDRPFRHPLEQHANVRVLLDSVVSAER